MRWSTVSGLLEVAAAAAGGFFMLSGAVDCCAEAGIDSGIIDPVASDLGRVFSADRDSEGYRLAADMLLGRDPFGGEFVGAFREGRLGAE